MVKLHFKAVFKGFNLGAADKMLTFAASNERVLLNHGLFNPLC